MHGKKRRGRKTGKGRNSDCAQEREKRECGQVGKVWLGTRSEMVGVGTGSGEVLIKDHFLSPPGSLGR